MNTIDKNKTTLIPPRIGEYWEGQGGVYQGVMRGEDGAPDYFLLVHKDFDDVLNHSDAMQRASEVEADGHKDYTLPTRYELALCFANRSELFKKDWYWSSTQRASDSGFAWVQSFDNGSQYDLLKVVSGRARAVRRLDI